MAQRIEPEGLIVSCDFCGTDWDGASPIIEGHRGALICLECLKRALGELQRAEDAYKCVLCLRDGLPAILPRFEHENRPGVFGCKGCIEQAADVFDRDADVPWTWESRPAKGAK